MKKIYIHIISICLFIFISVRGESAITSITQTPATPTLMSTSLGYFLAGKTYTFTVNVIDPAATGWGDITDVRITIANSTNIIVAIDPASTGAHTTTVNSGPVTSTASVAGTYNNFTATFNVRFLWNTAESAWSAGRSIIASATSTNTLTDTAYVSYGVCSTVQVTNIAMTGEAADGKIGRYHDTFNVTGDEVVYNVTGASSADAVRLRADSGAGEISYLELRINGIDPGGTDDADETDNIAIDVPSGFFIADSVTPRSVVFIVYMTTSGGPETSVNSTTLIFNSINVTNITFFGGGGIDSDPAGYYRSTIIPGTQVRIDAVMTAGGGNMDGNTTIELRDTTDGSITSVVIANGQNYGTAVINYPATITAAGTSLRSYEIYNVYGGAYCSAAGFGQYANNSARITQPGTHSIAWDNGDPPGANTPAFTTEIVLADPTTAGSLTVSWTPLASGFPDGDFDQYKFYYKRSIDTVWTVVDKTTTGYTALMPDIATGTITISGLAPLTNYDYMVSAVDIFGNEVLLANRITRNNVPTKPSTITITVTDGITSYDDASFYGNPNPVTTHPLRLTNIRIDASIITAGNVASQVDILIADNDSDTVAQWGTTGTADDLRTLIAGTSYFVLPTTKTGPNRWTGYIPSENPLMTTGRSIRIILKITYLTGVVYADYNSEENEISTDQEWRIYIAAEPKFTPWPTRILNNVIDDKNRIAYPAYYLSDDAYVTIIAYDIKGRPVAVLLENAYRKEGQNIKENGWDGTNKAGRKLGVGLYYVHIQAKRVSDGKIIIDKFNKVVMAR